MIYLKLYEEHNSPKYYVQSVEGAKELKQIKLKILDSMNPPMADIWIKFDDYMLPLIDRYGEDIIEYDSIDLCVSIPGKYTIATEQNYNYYRGYKTLLQRDENNLKIHDRDSFYPGYYKKGDVVNRLSIYGSSFDQEFFDYYKSRNGKLTPFYHVLIGPNASYLKDITDEKYQELVLSIKEVTKSAIKRLGGKILEVEQYNSLGNANWEKTTIDNVKYPRISVSFKI